jgi:hypothetical protein
MTAAVGGHEAMVQMLLRRGAGVNLENPGGFTALMGAAFNGHTTIAQALLDAKADASLQATDGRTALMIADLEEHTATAQLLRQHAKRQTTEAEAAVAHDAVAAPTPSLSGHRVRIAGLKGRPELNGRCGVAGRFDAAKGRYEVAVEGEAEAVLLKPANLQEVCANANPNSNTDPIALTPTLTPTLTLTLDPNSNPNPNSNHQLTPILTFLILYVTLTRRSRRCLKACGARRTEAMRRPWLRG